MLSMIQPFIPTIDFEISKQFYIDLGFEIAYEDDSLTLFKKDKVSFFIQKAYEKAWAENTMIQLYTDDVNAFLEHVKSIKSKYQMIKHTELMKVHYGTTFHLLDPAGVLWHITDPRG